MSLVASALACERVRSQLSLELDGELSQLERRMVAAHLSRCSQCHAYAEGTASFTRALRDAPLERLESPVVIRPRSRTALLGRFQVGVAAAVAVLAVGLGSQLGSASGTQGSGAFGVADHFQTRAELERELALIELTQSGGPDSSVPVL